MRKSTLLMEIPIISFGLGWWFFLVNLVICISSFKFESVSCSTPTFGNETDKLALLAFKNHLIDVPNGILSSWNDSAFCEWRGYMQSETSEGYRLCSKNRPSPVRLGRVLTDSALTVSIPTSDTRRTLNRVKLSINQ